MKLRIYKVRISENTFISEAENLHVFLSGKNTFICRTKNLQAFLPVITFVNFQLNK